MQIGASHVRVPLPGLALVLAVSLLGMATTSVFGQGGPGIPDIPIPPLPPGPQPPGSLPSVHNVELVGQAGNWCWDVAVSGRLACVVGVAALAVYDISDLANIRQMALILGDWNRVAVAGSYAYVVGLGSGDIIDLTNLPRSGFPMDWPFVEPGFVYFGPELAGEVIAVAGSYAYVGQDTSLRVVNISDPAHPVTAGRCWVASHVFDIVVRGSVAYVAGYGALYVVDVGNPASPSVRGSCPVPHFATGVCVDGSHAYVASHWDEVVPVGPPGVLPPDDPAMIMTEPRGQLTVVDVSDADNPRELSHCDVPGAHDVSICGSVAYVAYSWIFPRGREGMKVIDISDPKYPVVGCYEQSLLPSPGIRVDCDGQYAYLASSSGLLIMKFQSPNGIIRGVVGCPRYVVINPFGLQTDTLLERSLSYDVTVTVKNVSSEEQTFWVKAEEPSGVQIGDRYGDPDEDCRLLESVPPGQEREACFTVFFYGYTLDYRNEPVHRYLEFDLLDASKSNLTHARQIQVISPSAGSISGVAVNADLSPMKDGEISVYDGGSGRLVSTARLEDGGTYSIPYVAPGRYSLCYTHTARLPQIAIVNRHNAAIVSFQTGPARVSAVDATESIGRVTDPDGHGIAGASIVINHEVDQPSSESTIKTDVDGFYTIPLGDISDGIRFMVTASHPHYSTVSKQAVTGRALPDFELVPVPASSAYQIHVIVSDENAHSVIDSAGVPATVEVRWGTKYEHLIRSGKADRSPDGAFDEVHVQVPGPGLYQVRAYVPIRYVEKGMVEGPIAQYGVPCQQMGGTITIHTPFTGSDRYGNFTATAIDCSEGTGMAEKHYLYHAESGVLTYVSPRESAVPDTAKVFLVTDPHMHRGTHSWATEVLDCAPPLLLSVIAHTAASSVASGPYLRSVIGQDWWQEGAADVGIGFAGNVAITSAYDYAETGCVSPDLDIPVLAVKTFAGSALKWGLAALGVPNVGAVVVAAIVLETGQVIYDRHQAQWRARDGAQSDDLVITPVFSNRAPADQLDGYVVEHTLIGIGNLAQPIHDVHLWFDERYADDQTKVEWIEYFHPGTGQWSEDPYTVPMLDTGQDVTLEVKWQHPEDVSLGDLKLNYHVLKYIMAVRMGDDDSSKEYKDWVSLSLPLREYGL